MLAFCVFEVLGLHYDICSKQYIDIVCWMHVHEFYSCHMRLKAMTLRKMRPTLLYSKKLDSEGKFSPSQDDSNPDDKKKKIDAIATKADHEMTRERNA